MICASVGRAQLVLGKSARGDIFQCLYRASFGTSSTCFALANIEFANFVCSQLQAGMANPVVFTVLGCGNL